MFNVDEAPVKGTATNRKKELAGKINYVSRHVQISISKDINLGKKKSD